MEHSAGFGTVWRTLSLYNFRTYMIGNFASQLGMWVQRVAIQWLTWELTHSPLWLGIIAFADFFPNVVLAPVGGALADRLERLRAIRIYMSISAAISATIAALTVSGLITIELLCVLVLLNGVTMAFNYPVRLAMVPSLVAREHLPSAIAVSSVGFNIARISGPALAGLIISLWQVGPAVWFTVFADVVFVISLSFVTLFDDGVVHKKRGIRHIPEEILQGFRYVAQHVGIAPLLIILISTAVLARPFTDLFAGFSGDVFGRGADGLAWLTSMLGLGAVAASVRMAANSDLQGLTQRMISALLILSLAVIGFAATDIFVIALACTVVAGYSMVVVGVTEQTLLQAAVDGAMRGRVMSFYTLIARGCPAIGALLMGYLATFFGLRPPVAAGALACILIWWWARRQQDRMARHLEETT